MDEISRVVISCSTSSRRWTDIHTPTGPDMQVRWAGHTGRGDGAGPYEVTLEYRVKPSLAELDALGITREQSDGGG